MDFGWTDEQRRLRDAVVAFGQAELRDDVIQRDAEGTFSLHAWKACAEFGIQGLPVPREYGGREADPVTIAITMEALGYVCEDNGLLFALAAQMCSVEAPLVRFGTAEQKAAYLPGLCDGSMIAAHAMSEPESGSDAFSLETTAARRGSAYVLDGRKCFVTSAPMADLALVFARTDPGKSFAGVSAFLVERGTTGMTLGPPVAKMGLRTVPMGEVFFERCEVPEGQRLGREGAGLGIFNHSMEWERSFILAGAVGTMQRQLEQAIARAKRRRQFGQPIGKFQAVAHRIVDLELRLRTSRLLLYELAWLRSQGKPASIESAMVKLWISECSLASSLDALFIHGGIGYLSETGLERQVRDAVAGCIYSGTSDVQRNIIASRLGL